MHSIAIGQTCRFDSIKKAAPNERYLNNGDSTITDLETGFIWMQCTVGLSSSTTPCDTGSIMKSTWGEALNYVQQLNLNDGYAGFNDWRLPNIPELLTLAEKACFEPAINLDLFPDVEPLVNYWSSTSDNTDRARAYSLGTYYGDDRRPLKSELHYIRLVRGGPNTANYRINK